MAEVERGHGLSKGLGKQWVRWYRATKVEVDRIQNVVLPPVTRSYAKVWGIEVMVRTLDLLEIAAEKIRAAATRVRYRDFII
jgi:hypothetical protein